MKKPRRLLVAENQGKNIILTDPDLSDLQGYSKEIRSRWWKAYKEEGIKNPIVVAVHKRSKLARDRGLTEGPDFTFLALDTNVAAEEGWLREDLAEKPNRPPRMTILLATGEQVETHLVSYMTESGVIDWAHFDPRIRQELLLNHSALKRYLDEPWTWTN
jgi:hypothetical protein